MARPSNPMRASPRRWRRRFSASIFRKRPFPPHVPLLCRTAVPGTQVATRSPSRPAPWPSALLADGRTDRQIAENLSISPKTAGNHVTNILSKLDLDSRVAAATFAVRHGLA
ncbi:MAG: response regulator transcription factor [Chloroflexia bacterium]|nr:response regulator transcription factor [Chloroflexia bacterium]